MSNLNNILYFLERGEGNTKETLKVAKERAESLGIKDIVVASTRGETGFRCFEALPS